MSDEQTENTDEVFVTMEITGDYDDVLEKLSFEESRPDVLAPFVSDVDQLLETVTRIDGGTRSVIAERLPSDCSIAGDPQAVVETLQVLERYDLVTLEGNTWVPGPKIIE